jgi:hypothetical protein
MKENEKKLAGTQTVRPAILFHIVTLAILVTVNNVAFASPSSLLERYRGSHQERALDAQIKAYRPYALKNARTFGNKRDEINKSISICWPMDSRGITIKHDKAEQPIAGSKGFPSQKRGK